MCLTLQIKYAMKKILAFGASNSRNSINKKFAQYIAGHLDDDQVNFLDLNDYEMPIYSIDRENEAGVHELAHSFKQQIIDADGIVISFAEHNSAYSAAFKNIFDWVSRISADVWEGKPMFLAATAPGPWGGKSVLKLAYDRFSRKNKNTIVTFSLPEFAKNFDEEAGILKKELVSEFATKMDEFSQAL